MVGGNRHIMREMVLEEASKVRSLTKNIHRTSETIEGRKERSDGEMLDFIEWI
jgi:hypothetical protein